LTHEISYFFYEDIITANWCRSEDATAVREKYLTVLEANPKSHPASFQAEE
jgi:hypothetical protein